MNIMSSWRGAAIGFVLFGLQLLAQAPDPLAIIRKSVEIDHQNWRSARDYVFVQSQELRTYDKRGKVTKTESSTADVLIIDGTSYERKIAKDGKPLSDKEMRAEQAKFDKERSKRLNENEAQRSKRQKQEEESRAKGRAFLLEIPEAFLFKLAGEETIDGVPVWVLDAEPRPGYRPKAPRAGMLAKFKGRLWIEQKGYQWVKVEAESIAPVSFGFVLARLQPGARVSFHQQRLNDDLWLPSDVSLRMDARLALLKNFRVGFDVSMRDYRRFSTDSRILSVGEAAPK